MNHDEQIWGVECFCGWSLRPDHELQAAFGKATVHMLEHMEDGKDGELQVFSRSSHARPLDDVGGRA